MYWTICHRESLTSTRRPFAAGLGAYVGLNVAALCTAVEFGVQPTLFHSANGTPLYAPFHLSQTIPAMALAHLTVAGIVEFVLTAGVIAYLQRANLPVLRINRGAAPPEAGPLGPRRRSGRRWALIGIGSMILLTPLGLIASGTAFGEDASESSVWHHALLDGYGFGSHPVVGYVLSAAVGAMLLATIVLGTHAAVTRARRRVDGAAA